MTRVLKLAGQIADSALGVVGIRSVEEPHFIRRPLTDTVEIRQYGSRIAAETTVDGEKQRALNTGFRRLAGYIFGGNHRHTEIAMTAPVSQNDNADDGSTVRFFMPHKWSMETLPTPDSDDVRLVEVPPETVAVLRFSGDRSPEAVAACTDRLLETLRDNDIEPAGEAVAWFYDPPWTLPFRRRNEVAVPV